MNFTEKGNCEYPLLSPKKKKIIYFAHQALIFTYKISLQIERSLINTSAPSFSMVKKLYTNFRCGRTDMSNAERSGHPIEVTTPEAIVSIHDIRGRWKIESTHDRESPRHISWLNGCRVFSQLTTNANV